jgi:hypothetical protein
MAKNDWYTFVTSEVDDGFKAIKFDKDGDPLGEYKLNKNGSSCDCPAHVPFCRHKKMLVIFKDMERVNSGWQYQFDTDKWKAPIKLDPDLVEM